MLQLPRLATPRCIFRDVARMSYIFRSQYSRKKSQCFHRHTNIISTEERFKKVLIARSNSFHTSFRLSIFLVTILNNNFRFIIITILWQLNLRKIHTRSNLQECISHNFVILWNPNKEWKYKQVTKSLIMLSRVHKLQESIQSRVQEVQVVFSFFSRLAVAMQGI